MDDGMNGNFKEVYDGRNKPLQLYFTAVQLVTGLPYRFTVASVNINGLSQQSSPVTIYACLVPSDI